VQVRRRQSKLLRVRRKERGEQATAAGAPTASCDPIRSEARPAMNARVATIHAGTLCAAATLFDRSPSVRLFRLAQTVAHAGAATGFHVWPGRRVAIENGTQKLTKRSGQTRPRGRIRSLGVRSLRANLFTRVACCCLCACLPTHVRAAALALAVGVAGDDAALHCCYKGLVMLLQSTQDCAVLRREQLLAFKGGWLGPSCSFSLSAHERDGRTRSKQNLA
jgi:hypothetical protein